MTKEELINKYSDYFTNHEQSDYYQTVIKLNRSEFLGLVSLIYQDIMNN
jgi:hypothetical protein